MLLSLSYDSYRDNVSLLICAFTIFILITYSPSFTCYQARYMFSEKGAHPCLRYLWVFYHLSFAVVRRRGDASDVLATMFQDILEGGELTLEYMFIAELIRDLVKVSVV